MSAHPSGMDRWPHVVIIGGGFGGLDAAQALAKAPVRITLVDRRNHHLFQPLLYQVATAALNPSDIAYPIRAALAQQRNVARAARRGDGDRRRDAHGRCSTTARCSTTTSSSRPARRTATSARISGRQLAPGLKSVEDALEIRRRIFLAYEAAEREADPAAQREWLTFVGRRRRPDRRRARRRARRDRPAHARAGLPHDRSDAASAWCCSRAATACSPRTREAVRGGEARRSRAARRGARSTRWSPRSIDARRHREGPRRRGAHRRAHRAVGRRRAASPLARVARRAARSRGPRRRRARPARSPATPRCSSSAISRR